MWPNLQFPADLVTFTEETFKKNFIFCALYLMHQVSDINIYLYITIFLELQVAFSYQEKWKWFFVCLILLKASFRRLSLDTRSAYRTLLKTYEGALILEFIHSRSKWYSIPTAEPNVILPTSNNFETHNKAKQY